MFELEEMEINDALALMAARRDASAKLKYFGFRIWAADKPNAVLFRFIVERQCRLERVRRTGDGTDYWG